MPVYHVETPRPFISTTLPYIGMHPMNFLEFTGFEQNFFIGKFTGRMPI